MDTNNTSEPTPVTDAAPSSSATQVPFKVYRPPRVSQSQPSTSHELPDSYFEPTTGEIMALHQSRVSERERLVDGPLKTSVIREREAKQREAKYPNTTIRIKFPDQTQLERVFPSTDKIRSVYAFVRSTLREDVKPIKFVLYQTPPRRELKVSDLTVRDQTLFQLGLAPSSILMLSFFEESLNHRDSPAPLAESVLSEIQDLPAPPVFEPPRAGAGPEPRRQSSSSTATTSGEKKVPKWLKLSKK